MLDYRLKQDSSWIVRHNKEHRFQGNFYLSKQILKCITCFLVPLLKLCLLAVSFVGLKMLLRQDSSTR